MSFICLATLYHNIFLFFFYVICTDNVRSTTVKIDVTLPLIRRCKNSRNELPRSFNILLNL